MQFPPPEPLRCRHGVRRLVREKCVIADSIFRRFDTAKLSDIRARDANQNRGEQTRAFLHSTQDGKTASCRSQGSRFFLQSVMLIFVYHGTSEPSSTDGVVA